MPTEVDKLTKDSQQGQISAAISDCIAYHMKTEGLSQEEAAGKCFGMARDKTGKDLSPKGGS